ncbi:MAG: amino acid-binding protein [Planctomycetes bacterium SM23_25]|nr:MAG: amino acid-binding protein [Planctomycetes bacterium SM23_25]
MALDVTQVEVWAATIKDRPGGLAEKLDALAAAGANLGFVIARRTPDKPGEGVVFVTPIEGAAVEAAKAAGFTIAGSLRSLRVEAPDAPGLGARITGAVAAAGVNLRGISAAAIGNRCVCYLAFDSPQDSAKAKDALKGL